MIIYIYRINMYVSTYQLVLLELLNLDEFSRIQQSLALSK